MARPRQTSFFSTTPMDEAARDESDPRVPEAFMSGLGAALTDPSTLARGIVGAVPGVGPLLGPLIPSTQQPQEQRRPSRLARRAAEQEAQKQQGAGAGAPPPGVPPPESPLPTGEPQYSTPVGRAALGMMMPVGAPQMVRDVDVLMPSQSEAAAVTPPGPTAQQIIGQGYRGMPQPDFLAAPPGERQLEDFLFREMVTLGDRAPSQFADQWGQIQQAKRARVAARANHLAQMVQTQHEMDMRLRNADFIERGNNFRTAFSNIMNMRIAQAQIDASIAQQNVAAMNQFQLAQREAMSAMVAGPEPLSVGDELKLREQVLSPMREKAKMIESTRAFLETAAEFNAGLLGGMGAFSGAAAEIGAFAGFSQPQILKTRWGKLRNSLVTNYASEAGARAIDASAELRGVLGEIPRVGADTETIVDWTRRFVKALRDDLDSHAKDADRITKGHNLGTRVLEDLGLTPTGRRGLMLASMLELFDPENQTAD